MNNCLKSFFAICCLCLLLSCSTPEEFNSRAKYEGKEYVTLKKLYEIDTENEIFNNTYIEAVYDIALDKLTSRIFYKQSIDYHSGG